MSDNKNVKTRPVVTAHPSSLKHSNSNKNVKGGFWAALLRHWPITLSALLSLAWLGGMAYYVQATNISFAEIELIEASMLITAATMPLIILWLICLVFIRINPVEEDRRALESGLDQLLSPVEITQERINKVIENLKKEITKVEAAGDLATNRFKSLEDSFNEQINSLFEATTKADEKSNILRNRLSTERDEQIKLTTEIERNIEYISGQFKGFRKDAQETSDATKKHSEFLNNELSFQNKTLENRAEQIEENLETLSGKLEKITQDLSEQTNHSYENLNEVIDSFDERRAVLNNFMTALTDEVSSICDKLDKQAKSIDKLNTTSSKSSDKITKSIKKQVQDLSKIAEKAVSNVNATGDALEAQTKMMEETIEKATEKSKIDIADASEYFMEAANDMGNVSNDLENNIKQNFDEITDTITSKSNRLTEDINIHFQNIESDLDKGNSSINDLLIANLDQVEGHMKDSLEILVAQSDSIQSTLDLTRDDMLSRTSQLQEEYNTLENFADDFQQRMVSTENEFIKQHENMLSCIAVIEDGIGVAVQKIKSNSSNLGAHGQKVIENILSLSADLDDQINDIQNRSKSTLREIENASLKASKNLINQDEKTATIIEEWLRTANNAGVEHSENMRKIETLISEFITIEKSTAKSIDASEEKIKRISNELLHSSDRIHIASNSAIEAVEETNKALEKNAEKYQQMINAIQLSSQSLAANANAIENRMKRVNSEKFSDVSVKIMEKLQSGSVDIINYLEGDIPKDLWDKYLTGDRNIFVRKIKKHIGKKTTTDIRAHYLEDREFRKNTDSFVQIFEELLDTFTETTETVYSETLITSDIGKVYFALAEASGRLK